VIAFDDDAADAAKAKAAGIPVSDLRSADWSKIAALVLAPGVPLTHPSPHWVAQLTKKARVEVIGDIELFCRERRLRAPNAPFVAITGTNGKSTTTALIAHLAAAAGMDAQLGGNIGTAILSLTPPRAERVHVIECSSYQIDLAPSLDPSIGVLINLTEDHLDRHGTMENYAAVKERLVAGVPGEGTAIVGIDDEWCQAIAVRLAQAGKRVVQISVKRKLSSGLFVENGRIVRANSAGASLIADLANDSKATNADSAAQALACFGDIFWIAGGKPKTGGIEGLRSFFPRIRKAYLIGEAADEFTAALGDEVPHEIAGTLDEAVAAAARDAETSSAAEPVVLLSPACASFDQYRNFEVRGDAFRALVQALPEVEAKK